jgi:hypothetical protein
MFVLPEGVTRNEDGDMFTADGFKLLRVNGGRYLVEAPKGFVDDLGDPLRRRTEVVGREQSFAYIDRIRGWQPQANA